jgi:hypothetical protein
MGINEMYRRLDAPLAIPRSSWGAVRARDGAVFLSVWQDLKYREDGVSYMLVDAKKADTTWSAGYPERLQHLARVQAGAPRYLIMCIPVSEAWTDRKIRNFDEERLFRGGALVEHEGMTYIRSDGPVPVADVIWAKG